MPGRLEGLSIPEHVAIIRDGNGRWAEGGGFRAAGHKAGFEAVEQTVRDCARSSEVLTVYGFSTENWKRSEDEVAHSCSCSVLSEKALKVAKEETADA